LGRSRGQDAEEEVTRGLAGALAACLLATTAAADPVALQAAHVQNEDHAWHRGLEKFAEVLHSDPTAGVELAIHSRGTWGGETDYLHSLRQGLLDVTVLSPSVAGALAKHLAFFDVMMLWHDRDHWRRVVDGPVGERIAEMIESGSSEGGAGVRVLGFWGGTRRHLLCRKATYPTLDAMAGLRLGLQDNPMNLEIWRSLGLAPVAVPLRNSIALIDADIVEGVEADLSNAVALKLADVAPKVTLTSHGLTLRPLVISTSSWRKLTPAQQQLVLKAAAAATALVRDLEPRQEEEALTTLRASGAAIQDFGDQAQLHERSEALRRSLAEEVGLSRLLNAIEQESARTAH
jgi:TRAP-type C4-dicarboxylate transport system substrate-binding protein